MGKNHRHKKRVKSETNKLQLKSKKLPKGTNVTDTSFKTVKILIPEQLKSQENETFGKKKFTVLELTKRIEKSQTQAKNDALKQMMTLMASDSVQVTDNVSTVLNAILKSCLDMNKPTRVTATKVLAVLLETVRVDQIKPFTNGIVSHLILAMTHINPAIQKHSLTMIDVFIDRYPDVLLEMNYKVLRNFLNLISKQKSTSRELNIDFTKESAIQWRIGVLRRIHSILKVLLEKTCMKTDPKMVPSFYRNVYFTDLAEDMFTGKAVDPSKTEFVEFARGLIKLLFDIWLEHRPSVEAFQFAVNLNRELFDLLVLITEIIELTRELSEISRDVIFTADVRKSFVTYFFSHFPFAHDSGAAEMHENLLIAHLYVSFRPDNVERVLVFLKMAVDDFHVSMGNEDILLKIVKNIFRKSTYTKHRGKLEEIAKVLSEKSFSAKFTVQVLPVFVDLYDKPNEEQAVILRNWLEKVVGSVARKNSVSTDALKIILELCRYEKLNVFDVITLEMIEKWTKVSQSGDKVMSNEKKEELRLLQCISWFCNNQNIEM